MSSFHRHSSWGRTRRPKNLAGADGTYATPGVGDAALVSATAVTGADLRTTITGVATLSDRNLLNLTVAESANYVVGDMIQLSRTGQDWLDGTYKIETLDTGGADRIAIRVRVDGPRITSTSQIKGTGTITRRTTSGYSTENQRFLHVTTEAAVTAIYVYNYAAGRWRKLQRAITDDIGTAANDAVAIYKDVALAADTHVIIDIAGADRIAFLGTADKTVLAGSTF